MSIKKRGLGRGLEALLVNVSTLEDNQAQRTDTEANNKLSTNNQLKLNNANNQTPDEYIRQIADGNIIKSSSSTLSYQEESHLSNASHLLKEAESLMALLIEFEELLLNR